MINILKNQLDEKTKNTLDEGVKWISII